MNWKEWAHLGISILTLVGAFLTIPNDMRDPILDFLSAWWLTLAFLGLSVLVFAGWVRSRTGTQREILNKRLETIESRSIKRGEFDSLEEKIDTKPPGLAVEKFETLDKEMLHLQEQITDNLNQVNKRGDGIARQVVSVQDQVDKLKELQPEKTKSKANETQRFAGENRKMILQIMTHFPKDKKQALTDDINTALGGLSKFRFEEPGDDESIPEEITFDHVVKVAFPQKGLSGPWQFNPNHGPYKIVPDAEIEGYVSLKPTPRLTESGYLLVHEAIEIYRKKGRES